MKLITIDEKNIDNKHICCAIGNDLINKKRADIKKDWLKERFSEGLVFKRLDERGKVFVEYMPIEKSWKPVKGKNYLMIHCLWVSGKFKSSGFGKLLLEEVINDAKKSGKDGIAVITTKKDIGFTTDNKFFLKHGFEEVESTDSNYILLALELKKKSTKPKFTDAAKTCTCDNIDDFTIMYTNQCPFMDEYAYIMKDIIESHDKKCLVKKLETLDELRELASPFATFGLYYKGNLISHEPMAEKKLSKIIDKIDL